MIHLTQFCSLLPNLKSFRYLIFLPPWHFYLPLRFKRKYVTWMTVYVSWRIGEKDVSVLCFLKRFLEADDITCFSLKILICFAWYKNKIILSRAWNLWVENSIFLVKVEKRSNNRKYFLIVVKLNLSSSELVSKLVSIWIIKVKQLWSRFVLEEMGTEGTGCMIESVQVNSRHFKWAMFLYELSGY